MPWPAGSRWVGDPFMKMEKGRMVALGYGKYLRSDSVVEFEPIEEGRGPGKRTWGGGIRGEFGSTYRRFAFGVRYPARSDRVTYGRHAGRETVSPAHGYPGHPFRDQSDVKIHYAGSGSLGYRSFGGKDPGKPESRRQLTIFGIWKDSQDQEERSLNP